MTENVEGLVAGAAESTPVQAGAQLPAEKRLRSGIGRDGITDMIGQALQAHYDDLVAAPMPDRFLVLLAQLEAQEKKRG